MSLDNEEVVNDIDHETGKEIQITEESKRPNNFISSLLYSRLTVFHPSTRPTSYMIKKLTEVAKKGGTDPNQPLERSYVSSYGKDFQIDLHVDYLLQPHRDLLDTLLAHATTITLDDESYQSGRHLRWSDVFRTIEDGHGIKTGSGPSDELDIITDRSAIVLSMSMYELAQRMGMRPHRSVYQQIERRIYQLYSSFLSVGELDDNGSVTSRAMLRFIQDFRLFYDASKNKNGRSDGTVANHVFVIPDRSLLKSIKEHGYFLRLEQILMSNYSKPGVRSFIKYMTTHKASYINGKKLDWLVDKYIESIPSPVSRSFKYDLISNLLALARQIETDFKVQFKTHNNVTKIYPVGNVENFDETA
ncbi:DNA mismatch repair protein [Vibrio sp.]|uniref:DNA mismatch repair protein n=1 Tax=Vibrio sp. TaxID=678 RepID=UPI003D0ACBA6